MSLQEKKAKATDMNIELIKLQSELKQKTDAYSKLMNEIMQTPAVELEE